MKQGQVYILKPSTSAAIPLDEVEHITERNKAYGRKLAEITGKTFSEAEVDKIDQNDTIIVPKVLTKSEAQNMDINSIEQILGAVGNTILGSKIILHTPLLDKLKLDYFPYDFQKYLADNKLVGPGYSIFETSKISEALEKLKAVGINSVRFKPAWASGGSLQSQIVNQNYKHLEQFCSSNEDLIKREGIVLEANLTNSITYSGGYTLININGRTERFSYVGKQMFCNLEQFGIIDRYVGTTMTICKGNFTDLSKIMGELYSDAISCLEKIETGVEKFLSDNLECTRMNFDLLSGNLENSNKRSLYLSDHSFRPGAATLSELIGIKEILKGEVDHCTVMNKLSVNGQELVPRRAEVIYKGSVQGCDDVLVWGSVIDSI